MSTPEQQRREHERSVRRYAENRDEVRSRVHAYYEEHREEILEKKRLKVLGMTAQERAARRAYMRAYYLAHQEQQKADSRRRYEEHREEILSRQRRTHRHAEGYNRRYYAANAVKLRMQKRVDRAVKTALAGVLPLSEMVPRLHRDRAENQVVQLAQLSAVVKTEE